MPATWIETRELPLATLTRFPGNARRGNVEEIRASLRRNGQYRALVVRQCPDGQLVILAGNHTADALLAEGHQVARCEVIECADDEARRINLADNRTGELPDPETGERYDDEALAELFAGLDGDLEGTGWDAEDLTGAYEQEDAEVSGSGAPNDGGPGEQNDPQRGQLLALAGVTLGEPRHNPEPGQIWSLGSHRLVIGDVFTDWPLWAPLLDGDAVFLPYPTPLAPHAPVYRRLIMVQPETFLAGHLLDKWESVTGTAPVVVNKPTQP